MIYFFVPLVMFLFRLDFQGSFATQRLPLAAPLATVWSETSAGTVPHQQTADVRRRAVEWAS